MKAVFLLLKKSTMKKSIKNYLQSLPDKLIETPICEECLVNPSKSSYARFISYEIIIIFFRILYWWLLYQIIFQMIGIDVEITDQFIKFIYPQ